MPHNWLQAYVIEYFVEMVRVNMPLIARFHPEISSEMLCTLSQVTGQSHRRHADEWSCCHFSYRLPQLQESGSARHQGRL